MIGIQKMLFVRIKDYSEFVLHLDNENRHTTTSLFRQFTGHSVAPIMAFVMLFPKICLPRARRYYHFRATVAVRSKYPSQSSDDDFSSSMSL
jgi:hypothetical protein